MIFRREAPQLIERRRAVPSFPRLDIPGRTFAALAASATVTLARFRVQTSSSGFIKALVATAFVP
ncbi:hypothetical protein ACPOL_2713 [Acidisarcina polymorpha]|uniref:Uncharacterized protein n=1 Tax=Acidisarcina polymorpha TaxID=2211140 RepID=A0A2Z5G0B6_9BACT|nr:hypothetical protein [Acidisarcina polymorpha]AXC12026.1 hypothetical protein ACPOL_2713 [Acidisarcina polymorpha]